MAIKHIIVLFVETPRKFINKINKFNCNNKFTWCFRKQNYYKLLQICSQAVDKLCSHCLFPVVVTIWWHYQKCYIVVLTSLIQSWYNKNVTRLTTQGCNNTAILEVTIARKVLPHPQRMAPCAICWILRAVYKIPLCQDEIWGRMISMYWNESQCTIQQNHFLEIDYSSIISRSNNNPLELQDLLYNIWVLLTSIWTFV
jgi:hypothetical protein